MFCGAKIKVGGSLLPGLAKKQTMLEKRTRERWERADNLNGFANLYKMKPFL